MKMVSAKTALVRRSVLRTEGNSWVGRCNYWLETNSSNSREFVAKVGVRQPLILTGHGVNLRVEKGALLVRDGFTHYPQKQRTWRFFPGEWRLPSRIVVVDVDGGLSFAALAWLSEHNISLVQINWRGDVINIVSANAEKTISERVRSQIVERNKDGGLGIGIKLIQQKILNSIGTLQHVFPSSLKTDQIVTRLSNELRTLKAKPPSSISHLLGIEGRAGSAYFGAWRESNVKWEGVDRYPIPDDWHRIGQRSSKLASKSRPNKSATHPIHAMLNYAYGILESRVRMQVAALGLDPTIGIFHGNFRGKHGLVFDLMEPLRPIFDRQVLQFVQGRTFQPDDFVIARNGSCRLNPELARNVVRLVAEF